MAVSPDATVALAKNVAGIIKSAYGKSKKCLVLDLDNTLWGGVIGDDGVQGLLLGRDHPRGETFQDFQRYVKGLRRRGVILAICSKNDPDIAKEGFSHPDSILSVEDFSAFKANWNPKPGNIREIAAELNIGLDSIVFVDDNPAERAIVSEQLPEVATPDVGSDVSRFAEVLEFERYFEVIDIVEDDLHRSSYYKTNLQRETEQKNCGDYGEFLASLAMSAEITSFSPVYLERITQLINKTNQFNLTTKRYTSAEVERISADPSFVKLYGRLADRFGDNGLVSVVIGRVIDTTLELDLWLMSCRVLNREMELAMFDALVEQCKARGIGRIVGIFIPSKKNGIVADHYRKLGFVEGLGGPDGRQLWSYQVPREAQIPTARYIVRTQGSVSKMVREASPAGDSTIDLRAEAIGASKSL
jgi:FkbH-like protein